ncbi:hypothetical protein LCGC14_1698760 [marine sediment metagenome]|uniref:Uncharacterized protein n=1 Tax=marine sediment metagenome TaxID=412755 RepID=A0A0F9JZ69_9ZZZZ
MADNRPGDKGLAGEAEGRIDCSGEEMDNEDKKLIFKFSGFKPHFREPNGWVHEDGSFIADFGDCFNIAFYFKYAVPKVLEFFNGSKYKVDILFLQVWINSWLYYDKDPAEAFGQALLKLIKED